MFRNRRNAGVQLSFMLKNMVENPCIVYAIPRGGVPVGFEVSMRVRCPLEIISVRKIGMPGDEEFALGAVTEGNPGELYFNNDTIRQLNISESAVESIVNKKHEEANEIAGLYRRGRNIFLDSRAVAVIVDDGIATGATTIAAVNFLKKMGQKKIVLAVPVVQKDLLHGLETMVDEVVCVMSPEEMYAVGEFYEDFSQVTDEEVITLMDNSSYLMSRR
jgi:putative phosphoribosyl transferase